MPSIRVIKFVSDLRANSARLKFLEEALEEALEFYNKYNKCHQGYLEDRNLNGGLKLIFNGFIGANNVQSFVIGEFLRYCEAIGNYGRVNVEMLKEEEHRTHPGCKIRDFSKEELEDVFKLADGVDYILPNQNEFDSLIQKVNDVVRARNLAQAEQQSFLDTLEKTAGISSQMTDDGSFDRGFVRTIHSDASGEESVPLSSEQRLELVGKIAANKEHQFKKLEELRVICERLGPLNANHGLENQTVANFLHAIGGVLADVTSMEIANNNYRDQLSGVVKK